MEKDRETEGEMAKAVPSGATEVPEVKLVNFRGIPFPGLPFNAGCLEEIAEMKPEPGDIFVVTYPKCGTTWAQYIVWEIINRGKPPPNPNRMMFRDFPFLEATGVHKLHELPYPRMMKTHFPFQLLPYHPLAKYIYVTRNPWDCCVSYYHHTQFHFPKRNLPFEKFFDQFVQGKVAYGDFFDHVMSWYSHRNDPNVLFLSYENMSADPRGTMLTVAKFLGDHHYTVLKNDDQILNNCLKHSCFKYLKDMGMFITKSANSTDKNDLKLFKETMGSVDKTNIDREKFRDWEFFRKGVVGDWKNYFTASQIRRFNDYISTKVSDTEIKDLCIYPDQNELASKYYRNEVN